MRNKKTLFEKYQDIRKMYSKNIKENFSPVSVGYVHSVSNHDAVYMVLNGMNESNDV